MSNSEHKSLFDALKDDIKVEAQTGSDMDEAILSFFGSEIDVISDSSVAAFVKGVLMRLWCDKPEVSCSAFWVAPSSDIPGEHPLDEYNPGGLIMHTKRVTRAAVQMAISIGISGEDLDHIIAACLLHDTTKVIYVNDHGDLYFEPMHTLTVDTMITEMVQDDIENGSDSKTQILKLDASSIYSILRLIRCIHGIESPIPEVLPETDSEKIVAAADKLASTMHLTFPDLFKEMYYVGE